MFAILAYHDLHEATSDKNLRNVEGYLATHRLDGEPGQVRKLDHDVGHESKASTGHESSEGQIEPQAHAKIDINETVLQYSDKRDKKREES